MLSLILNWLPGRFHWFLFSLLPFCTVWMEMQNCSLCLLVLFYLSLGCLSLWTMSWLCVCLNAPFPHCSFEKPPNNNWHHLSHSDWLPAITSEYDNMALYKYTHTAPPKKYIRTLKPETVKILHVQENKQLYWKDKKYLIPLNINIWFLKFY